MDEEMELFIFADCEDVDILIYICDVFRKMLSVPRASVEVHINWGTTSSTEASEWVM